MLAKLSVYSASLLHSILPNFLLWSKNQRFFVFKGVPKGVLSYWSIKKYRYNLYVRLGISNQMQVKQIDWNCHLSVSQFNRWKKCTKHFARRNKIYSEFLKTTSTLFILNPFVHNASFLYTLKTSEKLTVFWCFHEVEKGCIMNEWVHILFSNAPFWFPLKTSENFDKLQEKSLFMLSFATFFW